MASDPSLPRSYYVTPRMTVDPDAEHLVPSHEQALASITGGHHVYVPSADAAHEVLISLGLSAQEAEERTRYGQTGHF